MIITGVSFLERSLEGNVFVTADHHFNHANILTFDNIVLRGKHYTSVEEMNNDLVAMHNALVSKDDVVIHLGDVCLGDNGLEFLTRLNGKIFLINTDHHHDKRWLTPYYRGNLTENIIVVPPVFQIKYKEQLITLSHFPVTEWNASYHGAVNLHAHCHGNLYKGIKRTHQLDCGVDVAKAVFDFYRPLALKDAVDLAKLPNYEFQEIIKGDVE